MKILLLIVLMFLYGFSVDHHPTEKKTITIDLTQQTLERLRKEEELPSRVASPNPFNASTGSTESPVSDVECMVEAIFWESKGEPTEGQRLVGTVIMNRVKSSKFPNTICGVVHQKVRGNYQFSYLYRKDLTMDKKSIAYQRVMKVAYEVLLGETVKRVSLKYYKVCSHPSSFFDNKLSYKFRSSNHCFFSEIG